MQKQNKHYDFIENHDYPGSACFFYWDGIRYSGFLEYEGRRCFYHWDDEVVTERTGPFSSRVNIKGREYLNVYEKRDGYLVYGIYEITEEEGALYDRWREIYTRESKEYMDAPGFLTGKEREELYAKVQDKLQKAMEAEGLDRSNPLHEDVQKQIIERGAIAHFKIDGLEIYEDGIYNGYADEVPADKKDEYFSYPEED
jgi:hypothetical protein